MIPVNRNTSLNTSNNINIYDCLLFLLLDCSRFYWTIYFVCIGTV